MCACDSHECLFHSQRERHNRIPLFTSQLAMVSGADDDVLPSARAESHRRGLRARRQLRTHEIGIRMALGAQPASVLKLVLREGLMVGLAGLVLGMAATLAVVRLLSGLLYGVPARGPARSHDRVALGVKRRGSEN
jgi:hypothetical protein